MSNRVVTIILAKASKADLNFIQGDIVGVDGGAAFALKHRLPIKVVIGDMDSLTRQQVRQLNQKKVKLITSSTQKNESDAELSIAWVNSQGYQRIIIVGFSGGRLDHYQSLLQRIFQLGQTNLALVNAKNIIQYYGPGIHSITKTTSSQYFSLFTFTTTRLSLANAKYLLQDVTITSQDTYTLSNEWVNDQPALLTVKTGGVLVFLSH
jgi:thiamine pyrophosphokinase